MFKTYELEYRGNKKIKQKTSYFCENCANKLADEPTLNIERSPRKFSSITCSGCSNALEEEAVPDFASTIITILEGFNSNNNFTFLRITRASDVKTKLDGAVKKSTAVPQNHDVIKAHMYERKDDIENQDPKEYLMDSELGKAANLIADLENFEYKTEIKESNDHIDMYVFIYNIKVTP